MRPSAVFLVLLLACAGNPTPEGPDPNCTGQRLVIVTNDWNEPVEVFARRADAATATSLGIVEPGQRSELVLLEGTVSAYVRTTRPIQPSAEPVGMRQRVHLRYQCR